MIFDNRIWYPPPSHNGRTLQDHHCTYKTNSIRHCNCQNIIILSLSITKYTDIYLSTSRHYGGLKMTERKFSFQEENWKSMLLRQNIFNECKIHQTWIATITQLVNKFENYIIIEWKCLWTEEMNLFDKFWQTNYLQCKIEKFHSQNDILLFSYIKLSQNKIHGYKRVYIILQSIKIIFFRARPYSPYKLENRDRSFL